GGARGTSRGGPRRRTGRRPRAVLGHPWADALAGPPRSPGLRGRKASLPPVREPDGPRGPPLPRAQWSPRERAVKREPEASDGILGLLARGQIKPLGLMPNASNYTFLTEVTDSGRKALAVYKPRDGETPLWDFTEGTLCRREVAAYVVSRALGWPAVPPTVLRDGPHGSGQLHVVIEAHPGDHFFTLRD